MKILGIETSCDETAAAVIEDGRRIMSNVVVSQIDIFAAYGGVIPEVAARSHLEAMMPVIDKALADAGVTWDEIDAIAVTYAPGLLGSLLIGTLTARTLAILHGKPLYAVHHLKSHVYANWLNDQEDGRAREHSRRWKQVGQSVATGAADGSERGATREADREPEFPLVALVVSGGHTQILWMPKHDQFEIIGTTRDDAVGECFDKVAKILGLPYPGGPAISEAAEGRVKLASGREEYSSGDIINAEMNSGSSEEERTSASGDRNRQPGVDSENGRVKEVRLGHEYSSGEIISVKKGDAKRYHLPIPKVEGLDFSFSGLKTAVLRAVQKEVGKPISFPSHQLAELLTPQQVADFAASFQRTAVEILVEKLKKAVAERPEVKSVVLAGGVAANEELRRAVQRAFSDLPVYFPAMKLSGDNGAMVGAAAYYEILAGVEKADPFKMDIYPRISIES